MASYPGAIWAGHTAPATLAGPPTHEDMHEDVSDEIVAVQTELGTNPSGSEASVAARFANMNTDVYVTGGSVTNTTDASGLYTVPFGVTFASAPAAVVVCNGSSLLHVVEVVHTATTTTTFQVRVRDFAGAVIPATGFRAQWMVAGIL
jgi:hypothetical protein